MAELRPFRVISSAFMVAFWKSWIFFPLRRFTMWGVWHATGKREKFYMSEHNITTGGELNRKSAEHRWELFYFHLSISKWTTILIWKFSDVCKNTYFNYTTKLSAGQLQRTCMTMSTSLQKVVHKTLSTSPTMKRPETKSFRKVFVPFSVLSCNCL